MNANQAKQQRERREARWDMEGSRGGHVIGHTSSGKPVYASANHPSHKEFSKLEHASAAGMHLKEADRLRVRSQHEEKMAPQERKNRIAHHMAQSEIHRNKAATTEPDADKALKERRERQSKERISSLKRGTSSLRRTKR